MAITKGVGATIAVPMVDATDPANLKSGLTLTCQRSYDGDGAFVACTNAATENGATGIYKLALTAAEMSHDSITIAASAAGACDQVLVLVTDEMERIRERTDTLGGAKVTVTSPVTELGTISLMPGSDYLIADNRGVPFNYADPSHVTGLDLATIELVAKDATYTPASVVVTVAGYTITFEFTAAQTSALTEHRQRYILWGTLLSGHVLPLAAGFIDLE